MSEKCQFRTFIDKYDMGVLVISHLHPHQQILSDHIYPWEQTLLKTVFTLLLALILILSIRVRTTRLPLRARKLRHRRDDT